MLGAIHPQTLRPGLGLSPSNFEHVHAGHPIRCPVFSGFKRWMPGSYHFIRCSTQQLNVVERRPYKCGCELLFWWLVLDKTGAVIPKGLNTWQSFCCFDLILWSITRADRMPQDEAYALIISDEGRNLRSLCGSTTAFAHIFRRDIQRYWENLRDMSKPKCTRWAY